MRFSLPTTVSLALLLGALSSAASAASSLNVVSATTPANPTTVSFSNGMSGFAPNYTFSYGALAATGPGSVTYTYLGSEAGYNNSFVASGNAIFFNHAFDNHGATVVGSSFTQNVASGLLSFGFSTKSPVYSVNNGVSGTYGADQGVFGIVSGASVANKSYQYVLIYNDPVYGGDHDYNDMAIGINFTAAVPEPESYAMLMAGLGLLSFVARRRRKA